MTDEPFLFQEERLEKPIRFLTQAQFFTLDVPSVKKQIIQVTKSDCFRHLSLYDLKSDFAHASVVL